MRPQPLLDHVRQERLGDQVGAGGVDGHDLVPQVQRGLEERDRRGDACDVCKRADRRQGARVDFCGNGALRCGHRLLRCDIDRVTECGNGELVADLRGHFRRLLAVEVEDHNRPAFPCIPLRDGLADAAVGGRR